MFSLVPSGLLQLIHQSFGVGMTCGRRRVSRDHSSERIVNVGNVGNAHLNQSLLLIDYYQYNQTMTLALTAIRMHFGH